VGLRRWEMNTHDYEGLSGIYSPPWEFKSYCWDDHDETWDYWYATSWKLSRQTKFKLVKISWVVSFERIINWGGGGGYEVESNIS
jgi:hypothetical protein